jgi:hypothetical protein
MNKEALLIEDLIRTHPWPNPPKTANDFMGQSMEAMLECVAKIQPLTPRTELQNVSLQLIAERVYKAHGLTKEAMAEVQETMNFIMGNDENQAHFFSKMREVVKSQKA